MKTVILMRHAEAVPESSAARDFDRPLTAAGEAMAEASATVLTQEGVIIDRILTSAARRTLQTAEALAVRNPDAPCMALDHLYLSPGDAFASAIRKYSEPEDQTVAIVGHNPGISHLMRLWSGRTFSVSPATVVTLDLDTDRWSDLLTDGSCLFVLRLLIQDGRRTATGSA